MSVAWPPSALEILRAGRLDGLSFRAIAEKIGGGTTRNSCVGKARRLGLISVEKPTRALSPLPRRGKPAPKQAQPATPVINLQPIAEPLAQANYCQFLTKTCQAPEARPNSFICTDDTSIPIMQLVDGVCKWPYTIQDEPTRYCGVKALDGRSWCETHAKRVWQTAKPARVRA